MLVLGLNSFHSFRIVRGAWRIQIALSLLWRSLFRLCSAKSTGFFLSSVSPAHTMKHTSVLAGVLLAAAAHAAAPERVVQWDIARRQAPPVPLYRRGAGTLSGGLQNDLARYYVDVEVGTPPQKLQLQLDTGSSDVWVLASSASICAKSNSCSEGSCKNHYVDLWGSFSSSLFVFGKGNFFFGSASADEFLAVDADASSTYSVARENGFNITYGDGDHVTGDYFTDTLAIAGATVKSLTMGLGKDAEGLTFGLVGVGYAGLEAIAAKNPSDAYPSLGETLVRQNLTNTNAYSLWLNDLGMCLRVFDQQTLDGADGSSPSASEEERSPTLEVS